MRPNPSFIFGLLSLFPLFTRAQSERSTQPIRGCDEIQVVTTKTDSEAFLAAGRYFSQKGYEILKADKEFFQIKTGGKRVKTGALDVKIAYQIRVIDGAVFVQGRFWGTYAEEDEAQSIKNAGLFKTLFEEMRQTALAFYASFDGKEVYYLKK